MYKKVISIVKVTLCSMALIGLFTACGNTVNVKNVESTVNNKVIESTTVAESEIATTESEATAETNIVVENKEANEETNVAVESEVVSGEGDTYPNYNGDHAEETLKETEQTYNQYTDIDPTTMYVINTNNMDLSVYRDPNITGGVLMEGGVVESNQEIIIDGKTTYNNTDYYRIAYKEGSMIDYQMIIPSEFVVAEKQEVQQQPTTTPAPEVQQSTQSEQQPSNSGYDPSLGISEEDWNSLFGGGASNGGHTWEPDNSDNYSAHINEKGGFTIIDPDMPDEIRDKVGSLIFH